MLYRVIASVVVIAALVASAAQAAIMEDFESESQGAVVNGQAIGGLTASVASGTAQIIPSPFVAGGNNAFQYSGATYLYASGLNIPDVSATTVSFDLNIQWARTSGTGSWFLDLDGRLPDNSVAMLVRLYYKMNAGATQTWLIGYNGNATTYTDYTYLPLNTNARIDVTLHWDTDTYDVSVTLDDSTVLTSYTGLGLYTAGAVALDGIGIGDYGGTNMQAKVDNIVVPEPASMLLAAAGALLFARRRV
ncbi:MAG: PEP-CTERM sorting domain-containing protein [Phycisphaeraceae bacterium]|nr:PEP-CTERM sorting domain-containing protein [Phycisphaeraceae bacterium]